MTTSIFQIEKHLSIKLYERADEDHFVEMSLDETAIWMDF